MQVDPGSVRFAQERPGLAGCGIKAQQIELSLGPVLHLGRQPAAGQPLNSGQIDIHLRAQVHPDRLAARTRDHAQAHPGVLCACKRVAVIFLGRGAGIRLALVYDAVNWDVPLVNFHEGQLGAVGRPPVATVTLHLFLGDVLGQPMAETRLAAAEGQSPRLASLDRDHVQFGILDVGHPPAVWREPGIDDGLPLCGDQQARLAFDRIQDEQIALQGQQYSTAFARPGIVGNARFHLPLPFAAQCFFRADTLLGGSTLDRGQQQASLACRRIEGEHLPAEAAVSAKEKGDQLVVGTELNVAGYGHAWPGAPRYLFHRNSRSHSFAQSTLL